MSRMGVFCLSENKHLDNFEHKNSALRRERCNIRRRAPLASDHTSPAPSANIVAYCLFDCKDVFIFRYHQKPKYAFMFCEFESNLALTESVGQLRFPAIDYQMQILPLCVVKLSLKCMRFRITYRAFKFPFYAVHGEIIRFYTIACRWLNKCDGRVEMSSQYPCGFYLVEHRQRFHVRRDNHIGTDFHAGILSWNKLPCQYMEVLS